MWWMLWVGVAGADGPAMSLDMDSLNPGFSVDVGVYQAAPGARVLLIRSDGGEGRGPRVVGGPRMGIRPGSGYEIVMERSADERGFAQWHVPAFPDVSDGDWWFQAIVIDADDSQTSNVLHRPVFEDARRLDDGAEPDDDWATATWMVDEAVYERRSCQTPDVYATTLAPGEAISVDFARWYDRPELSFTVDGVSEPVHGNLSDGAQYVSWLNEGAQPVDVSVRVEPSEFCRGYTLHTRMGLPETCVPPVEGSTPEDAIQMYDGVSYSGTICAGTEAYFEFNADPGLAADRQFYGPGGAYLSGQREDDDILGRPLPYTAIFGLEQVLWRASSVLEEGVQNIELASTAGRHALDIPSMQDRWTVTRLQGSTALQHSLWGVANAHHSAAPGRPVEDEQPPPALRTWGQGRGIILHDPGDGVQTPATAEVVFTEPVDCSLTAAESPVRTGHAGEVWVGQNCGRVQTFDVYVPWGGELRYTVEFELSEAPSLPIIARDTPHPEIKRIRVAPELGAFPIFEGEGYQGPFRYVLRTEPPAEDVAPTCAAPPVHVHPFSARPIVAGESVHEDSCPGSFYYLLHVPDPGTFVFTTQQSTLAVISMAGSLLGGGEPLALDSDVFVRASLPYADSQFEVVRANSCPGNELHEPLQSPMEFEVCDGQTHQFTFDAQPGQVYQVHLDHPGSQSLSRLEVYAPDGTMLEARLDSPTLWHADQTGEHRVHVVSEPVRDRLDVAHTLHWDLVQPETCITDAFEPNDSLEDASPPVTGADGVVCTQDEDWYAFEVGEHEFLRVDVEGDVRLHPHGEMRLSYDYAYASRSGTAVLEIEHTGGQQGNNLAPLPYHISVTRDVCTGGEDPEPNSIAGAAVLSVGDSITGTLCPDDQDWFMLSIPEDWATGEDPGFSVVVSTESPTHRVDTDLQMVQGGTQIQVRRDRSSLTYQGTYPYTLTIVDTRSSACEPDAYEPNNTPETAYPLGDGTYDITTCDDDDYFTVHLPARYGLWTDRASIYPSNRSSPPYFFNDARDVVLLGYDAQQPMTIEILPPCSADGFAPNSLQYLAAAIGAGNHSGGLCVPFQEEDWYRLDLDSNEVLAVRADFDSASYDPNLELYDENQELLVFSDFRYQPFEQLTWVAPAPQSVFLRVSNGYRLSSTSSAPDYDISYDLQVDLVP